MTSTGNHFKTNAPPSKVRLPASESFVMDANTYAEILRRPEVTYATLPIANRSLADDITQEVEIQLKYDGYIARDLEQIERFRKLEDKQLPGWMNYDKIDALRFESRQKLTRYRPDSIGQASRIPGRYSSRYRHPDGLVKARKRDPYLALLENHPSKVVE